MHPWTLVSSQKRVKQQSTPASPHPHLVLITYTHPYFLFGLHKYYSSFSLFSLYGRIIIFSRSALRGGREGGREGGRRGRLEARAKDTRPTRGTEQRFSCCCCSPHQVCLRRRSRPASLFGREGGREGGVIVVLVLLACF